MGVGAASAGVSCGTTCWVATTRTAFVSGFFDGVAVVPATTSPLIEGEDVVTAATLLVFIMVVGDAVVTGGMVAPTGDELVTVLEGDGVVTTSGTDGEEEEEVVATVTVFATVGGGVTTGVAISGAEGEEVMATPNVSTVGAPVTADPIIVARTVGAEVAMITAVADGTLVVAGRTAGLDAVGNGVASPVLRSLLTLGLPVATLVVLANVGAAVSTVVGLAVNESITLISSLLDSAVGDGVALGEAVVGLTVGVVCNDWNDGGLGTSSGREICIPPVAAAITDLADLPPPPLDDLETFPDLEDDAS